MSGPRHRIRRQILEVALEDQDGARRVQSELGRIQRECLEAIIDRCCTEAGDPERLHRIDSIEVDLGEIAGDDLERCMSERLVPRLLAALSVKIREADDASSREGSDPEAASRLELLAQFTRTGSLPWWADAGQPQIIDDAVAALLLRAARALLALTRMIARERDQLRRLVRHAQEVRLWALFRGLLDAAAGPRGVELGALLDRSLRVAGAAEGRRALWVAALRAASVEGSAGAASIDFWRPALAHAALELALPVTSLVTRLRDERSARREGEPDPVNELLSTLAHEIVGGLTSATSTKVEDTPDEFAAARRSLREAIERITGAAPAPRQTDAETGVPASAGSREDEVSDEFVAAPGPGNTLAPADVPTVSRETHVESDTPARDGAGGAETADELAGASSSHGDRRMRATGVEAESGKLTTTRGSLGQAIERVAHVTPSRHEMDAVIAAAVRRGTGDDEASDELAAARRLLDKMLAPAADAPLVSGETDAESGTPARTAAGEAEAADELAAAGSSRGDTRRLAADVEREWDDFAAPRRSLGEAIERAGHAMPGRQTDAFEPSDDLSAARGLFRGTLARADAAPTASRGEALERTADLPPRETDPRIKAHLRIGEVKVPDELATARQLLEVSFERAATDTVGEARASAGDIEELDVVAASSLGKTFERAADGPAASPDETRTRAIDVPPPVEDEFAAARRSLGEELFARAVDAPPPAADAESEARARRRHVQACDKLATVHGLLEVTFKGAETDVESKARTGAGEVETSEGLTARALGGTLERAAGPLTASPGETPERAPGASSPVVDEPAAARRALREDMLAHAAAPPVTDPEAEAKARIGEIEAWGENAPPRRSLDVRFEGAEIDPGSEPRVSVDEFEALNVRTARSFGETLEHAADASFPARDGDNHAASELDALERTLARLERSGIPAANLVTALRAVVSRVPGHLRRGLDAESRELAQLCSTLGPETSRTASSFTAWLRRVLALNLLPSDALARGLAELKERQARSRGKPKRPRTPANMSEHSDDMYVDNAGLVILWPFLGSFFERLGLMTERRFNDDRARCRAAGLLQHVVTGELEPPEYQLVLAKVLCGMGVREEFEFGPPVTEVEAEECTDLLGAVIANAPILREMSIDGFRGSFLLRKGLLGARDAAWLLRAERASYDVVLDRFPWALGWMKLPWMEAALRVEW